MYGDHIDEVATESDIIGLGAEYLVAADLTLAGHKCSVAAVGMPYDLVADIDCRLIRVQVKATAARQNTPGRKTSVGVFV